MIRHIAMFTWTEDATEEQKAAVTAELLKLPGLIPQIRAYTAGADEGINPGNYHYAVVADFDNVDDYIAYRDHPGHRKTVADHITPIAASRAAVQIGF